MNNSLNLRSVDLNLLVFFDAVMAERNVTRAANKIAVSQSAMSNALARLRHLFRDELFIRTARGMEPTPRAVELGPAVRDVLQQTTRLMASDAFFDPGTSERHYICRMSDLVGSLILPSLYAHLGAKAPGVTLEVQHLSPEDTVAALEADRMDVAVSMHLSHRNTVKSKPLFADRMVVVMREGHPLAVGSMTLKRLLTFGHVRVAMSPTDIRFVDDVLAEKGMRRHIALTVPHWLLVPRVLAASDLVAVMSERVGRTFTGSGTVMRPVPYAAERFHWTMYWHRRYDRSRSHLWLRDCLIAATHGIG